MIKVAGAWEHGWDLTTEAEYHLWNFPCRAYAVDEWYMAPISDMPDRGKLLTQVPSIEDAILLNPDLVPVFVEENGETDLLDFQHPSNALYIFGRAGYSAWRARGRKGISVRITVPVGIGMLWGHQCLPLVLQHRMGLNS